MSLRLLCGLTWVLLVASGWADEPAPTFFRGLNLNGPAVMIDGHSWDGADSKQYVCRDKAFENQKVSLQPATDAERARMIRSSRWGGNRVELLEIPAGAYTVFLYVWEDNDPENYSISLNGRPVVARHNSGRAGHWDKLGPWHVQPQDGKIIISSQGGAANFSGIEIWRGHYDGLAATLSEEDVAFFEKRIRPLLVDKCYDCHSSQADELQGELLVDSRATLRRGGSGGPAVVPGDPDRSRLIQAVRYLDPNLQMPPDERLSDQEIADLERWVKIGAPDPRSQTTRHAGKQIDLAAARQFWSLRPIVEPKVPDVANSTWPINDVDRFILAKLTANQLAPAPDADKRTLIRRATYDLTGLPPTPAELAAFLTDDADDAYARLIDRLLDSPRYGERWGRHWLDVVRYADTAGDNSDYPIPQMHKYRDWVIDALNRDLPYDEFVRDQLAGDLRGGATDEERQRRIIATGYIANARRFGSRVDDYPQHLTIEDTIDNLGRAFLGLSLTCARCHDHKFDPLTTRDYYGLYGIFQSTRYPWPGIELDKRQRDLVVLAPSQETAYAVAESKTLGDAAIQLRGDPGRLGDIAPRKFPVVLGGHELPPSVGESGRLQLAEWILADDNPLTARVVANRLWQHHFGRGLVPTPNDFGRQGKPPSHPELLDFLAVRLRTGGWSLKSFHRLVMLSRTYRQSSARSEAARTQDPANEWLAGFTRRRLDAESIRDTLLAVAGNLDLTPAGAHPFPPQDKWDFTQHKPFKAVYESDRRSVYLMTQRIQRHPYLALFDGADPSTSTGARMTSTTSLQALFLLNDPLLHRQTTLTAARIQSNGHDTDSRVQFAYELLLARTPNVDERMAAREFIAKAQALLQEEGRASGDAESQAWQAYTRSLFRLNEFVYID
ncbi:MAG: PSD1 and planctomycete cytochrome C domain-containing protein [Pirellulales bacterium]